MLPPVLAVVATSANASRPATATADTLGSLPSIPLDDSLALTLAANAELEGRLTILLLAARERMFDSLAAVINALSDALNLPKDADETGSAYALRLADVITNLTEPQRARLQQQLQAKVQMPPLTLIAAALNDPTGDAAAQIVAYLEVVRYKERDLATKAVVSSYGMNGSAAEAENAVTAMPQLPARMVTEGNPQSQAPRPAALSAPEAPAASKVLALLAAADSEAPAVEASIETFFTLVADAEAPSAEEPPLPGRMAAKPAGSASPAAAPEGTPPAQSDDRLKAVVQRVIASVGPELLDIIADRDHVVETVLAQALVADMLDDQELVTQQLKDADNAQSPAGTDRLQTASLPNHAAGLDGSAAARQSGGAALAGTAMAAPPQAQPQAPALPLGVPFAVAQYLPRPDERADDPAIAVDRIDPDEEERGGQKQQASDQDEGSEQQEADEDADGDQPSAEVGETPAFGMYRRMADWE